MPSGSSPTEPGNFRKRTIPEELEFIRKQPFRFSCLGINCLGWLIILAIGAVVYFLRR